MKNEKIYSVQNGTGINLKNDLGLDINKLIRFSLKYWWMYVLFIIISLGLAFALIKLRTPIYKVHAKILVKDSKNGGQMASESFFPASIFLRLRIRLIMR